MRVAYLKEYHQEPDFLISLRYVGIAYQRDERSRDHHRQEQDPGDNPRDKRLSGRDGDLQFHSQRGRDSRDQPCPNEGRKASIYQDGQRGTVIVLPHPPF